jgi:TonB family protein
MPTRWTPGEIAPGEFPISSDGYEDLAMEPEPAETTTARPSTSRRQSESSLTAARGAGAPAYKAVGARSGLPVIPIAVGVVLVLAITAFALIRGRTAALTDATPLAIDPRVTTIGRPPEPITPPVAEPEPAAPVVTIDLPADGAAAARQRRKAPEREAPARPARPAPPPAREVVRVERVVPVFRPAPASAPAPVPRVEAEPPPVSPPQFVAATPQEPPAASAPMAIGPTYEREGYQKARQARPGCVVNTLRLPRDMADVGGESATVKFAVNETGRVTQFTYLSGPTDPRIANAIWSAVQRCEWVPGATSQGRPISLWVTMPIKFGN